MDARQEGDYTASLPTHVSNEEAEQGQREWNDYYKKLRQAEHKVNGGGCVFAILPFVMVVLWVVC